MRKQKRTTKDFHVRVLEDDRNLVPANPPHLVQRHLQQIFAVKPEADIGLDVYLEDFEGETDLPDSDRIMICQRKGISEENCLRH